MAAPIGKGDWVTPTDPRVTELRYGALYCVESAEDHPETGCCADCGGTMEIELAGVPKDPLWAWCTCELKPIYSPKQEIIEALKAPPIRVRKTEDA